MLPVSLDFPLTGNIGYTRRRGNQKRTIQRNWQHRVPKTKGQFLSTPSSCVPYVASFSGLFVFAYPFVLCALCCQFLWIVRFLLPLRLVYPMLPASLDCQFLITPSSCVPYVASFSGLSVLILPLRLVYPMLPVSLDCSFLITPSSCVPYVASFSGLSVFDYPFVLCTLCCQFLWIVRF
jgi:hypothetical protein